MKCITSCDLNSVFDIKKGETVYIIGAGPSLFHIDIRKFEKHDCIYLNSSALIIPEVFEKQKVWLSVDRLTVRWSYFWKKVVPNDCLKFVTKNFNIYQDRLVDHDFRFFEVRKSEKYELYDNKLSAPSSLPAAIDLALKMGYSKILLFGVDHRFIQGKSHFWQFYPPSKQPVCQGLKNIALKKQKEMFDKNIPFLKILKNTAAEIKVSIINCSRRITDLKVFPVIIVNEGLNM